MKNHKTLSLGFESDYDGFDYHEPDYHEYDYHESDYHEYAYHESELVFKNSNVQLSALLTPYVWLRLKVLGI